VNALSGKLLDVIACYRL